MKRIIIAIAAIAALFSSCKKVDVEKEKPTEKVKMSFTASISGTKTTLDFTDRKVAWENTDVISINGSDFTTTTSGSSVTFTGPAGLSSPYNAICPSTLKTATADVYALPGTQIYASGKANNLPMYATSSDHSLTFKNICGVIAVNVKQSDMEAVKKIRLSSDSNMYGDFTVVSEAAVLSATSEDHKSVVLDCGSIGVAIGADGVKFPIAVPAGDYGNLKVELSSDGTNYTKTMAASKSTITVEVNKIYTWGFVPVGTYVLKSSPTVTELL